MVVPAILGAAAAIGGGILSHQSARQQNIMQQRMAREQMAFQERMSSTAYQRAVRDMRAAGINPMLAYERGGASSPGGAQPQMVGELAGIASSAMAVKRFREEVKNLQATRRLTEHETSKRSAEIQVLNKERENYRLRNDFQYLLNQLTDLDLVSARNVAAVSGTPFGRMMEYLRRIPGVGAFLPAITPRRR